MKTLHVSNPVVARSVHYRLCYTNHIKVAYSNFDLSLSCGYLEVEEEGTSRMVEEIKLVMSLEHAKAFSRLIAEAIVQVESQLGPIPEPRLPAQYPLEEVGQ